MNVRPVTHPPHPARLGQDGVGAVERGLYQSVDLELVRGQADELEKWVPGWVGE